MKKTVLLPLICAVVAGCAQKEITATDSLYMSTSNPPLNITLPDDFWLVDNDQEIIYTGYANSYGGSKFRINEQVWLREKDQETLLFITDYNFINSRRSYWLTLRESNKKLCEGEKVRVQGTDFETCGHPNNGKNVWRFSMGDMKSCGYGVRFQYIPSSMPYRKTVITYAEKIDCSQEIDLKEYKNLVERATTVLHRS